MITDILKNNEVELLNNHSLSLDVLRQLNQISIENLIENGGTLKYTFFQIMSILDKALSSDWNFNILILKSKHNKSTILGYAIFYIGFEHNIQISQICLTKNLQGMHNADLLLNYIADTEKDSKCTYITEITADISYNNKKSINFFKRHKFEFFNNNGKWRVKKLLK